MWGTIFVISTVILAAIAQTQPPECDMSERPKVRPKECCPMTPAEKTMEAFKACGPPDRRGPKGGSGPPRDGPEGGDNGGPPNGGPRGGHPRGPGPMKHSCETVICVMKQQNLLNDENNVDTEAFKAFIEDNYKDDIKTAISKSFEDCKNVLADTTATCQPKRFMSCLKFNHFLNCPESIWKSTPDCEAMREKFRKCPPSFVEP